MNPPARQVVLAALFTAGMATLACGGGKGTEPSPSVSPTNTTITLSDTVVVASSGSIASTVTVVTKDAGGNVLGGVTVAFSSTGTGNAFSLAAGKSDETGVITTHFSSTRAEPKTLKVTLNSAATLTVALRVSPAAVAVSRSTFVVLKDTVAASAGADTTGMTLTVRDTFDNAIPGLSVGLSASGSANTLSASSITTGPSGTAHATLTSTRAEKKVVSAAVAGHTLVDSLQVVAGVMSPAQSTLHLSLDTIAASSGTALAQIALSARDSFVNTIAARPLSYAVVGAGPGDSLGGTSTTDGSGNFTTSYSSTVAGSKLVRVVLGAVAIGDTLVVRAGAFSAANSGLSVSADTIAASTGSVSATLTVSARDGFGNRIDGEPVSIGATGISNLLSPAAGTTSGGVFTAVLSSTHAETKLVTAVLGGASYPDSVVVVAGPVVAPTLTVGAPTLMASSGGTTVGLTVTAADQFLNPVSGAAVLLNAAGAEGTFTPPAGQTAAGSYTAAFSATLAGQRLLGGTVGGVALAAKPLTVVATALDAAHSTLTARYGGTSVLGFPDTITVVAADSFGNLLAGAAVSFADSNGTLSTLTPLAAVTDGQGLVRAVLTPNGVPPSNSQDTSFVTVSVAGHRLLPNQPVIIDAGPATLTINGDPNPTFIATTGVDSFLVIDAAGADGLPVAIEPYGLSLSNGTGLVAVFVGTPFVSATRPPNARATAKVRKTSATATVEGRGQGTDQLTFHLLDNTQATIAGLVIQPTGSGPAIATVQFTPAQPVIPQGQTTLPLAITYLDGAGNRIIGKWNSSWTTTGGGPIAPALSCTYNVNGDCTTTLTSGAPGSAIIALDNATGFSRVDSVFVEALQAGIGWGSVDAGQDFTCGIALTGTAYCWGDNVNGQLGDPASAGGGSLLPAAVQNLPAASQISAGTSHACATSSGSADVYCWGDNSSGQLGDSSTSPRQSAVAVAGGIHLGQVSAGLDHTCGVTVQGTLVCWGENSSGQLGLGATSAPITVPTPVSTGPWSAVSAGARYTCAIDAQGGLFCWGDNPVGQLGTGDNSPRLIPTAIAPGTQFATVETSLFNQTCAVTTVGQRLCWGDNGGGQLGINSVAADVNAPTALAGDASYSPSLAMGGAFGCATPVGGGTLCYGLATSGELGNNLDENLAPNAFRSPVAGAAGLTFTRLTAGSEHACGLVGASGVLYCWGRNDKGQVGDGDNSGTPRLLPTRVGHP